MSNCRLSPLARRDLREIHDYIARSSPATAARFIEFLLEKGQMLARWPDLGERRDDLAPGIRCFTARGYVFLYRCTREGIEMVRVVSGSRDIDALFEHDK